MTVAMIMQVVMMLVVIVMINTRYLPHHQVAVILEYNSCISYTFSTDSNLSSVIGRESPCMTFFKSRVPDLK